MSEKERLNYLNEQCKECLERSREKGIVIDYNACTQYCPIGREIHGLDNKAWDEVDWNSGKWEHLYRH